MPFFFFIYHELIFINGHIHIFIRQCISIDPFYQFDNLKFAAWLKNYIILKISPASGPQTDNLF